MEERFKQLLKLLAALLGAAISTAIATNPAEIPPHLAAWCGLVFSNCPRFDQIPRPLILGLPALATAALVFWFVWPAVQPWLAERARMLAGSSPTQIIYPAPPLWRQLFPPTLTPLGEAARHLRDGMQGTRYERYLERNWGENPELLLRVLAGALWRTEGPIYGKPVAGHALRLVDKTVVGQGQLLNNASEFRRYHDRNALYTDLCIRTRDLKKAIKGCAAENSTCHRMEASNNPRRASCYTTPC